MARKKVLVVDDDVKVVEVLKLYLNHDGCDVIAAYTGTEGLKLAQIALTMGANDMGGVLMEEVVVKATGITTRTNEKELIHIIRNAGKIPVQRDSRYRVIKEWV